MTTVEHENERFLFASDVQGQCTHPRCMKFLLRVSACFHRWSTSIFGRISRPKTGTGGNAKLGRTVKNVSTTVLEHHLLREANWQELSKSIFEAASKKKHSIVTAAEFLKNSNNILESRRKQLFETEPPSIEFEKWMEMPIAKRKLVKPPMYRQDIKSRRHVFLRLWVCSDMLF